MIEISHKQARYLLREKEDRRLPEEQWAALQAHLERCPECSAYRDRMAGLERELSRGLHGHWGGVHPLLRDIPAWVISFRAARKQRLRRSLNAALALLVIVTFVVLRWNSLPFAPRPTPTPTPTGNPIFPTPTPEVAFRGVVVFQASPAGNSDIFLLNQTGASQDELFNLTNDPAQDTDPAWSPDGEWIAFLSDRSGKRELYVINVAGTRLTQMTDDPSIDWQGPLTWSADGKMIGLAGRLQDKNNERWLYVVPIAGSGPFSLPGTRGESGWVHFSPSQPLLATSSMVRDYENEWLFENWYGLPTIENNQVPGLPAGTTMDFDWALGGNSLVYLYEGRPLSENGVSESQIRLSPVFGLNNRENSAGYVGMIVARAPVGSRFHSITYMPGGPYIATLIDPRNTGCWMVRLIHLTQYNQVPPIDFPGLCVESSLEHNSWQVSPGQKEPWLVVTARPLDPTTHKPSGSPGLYALMPAPPYSTLPPDVNRLSDLPKASSNSGAANSTAVSIPRVRPSGTSLDIQPQAAKPPASPLRAAIRPPEQSGVLLAAGQPDPAGGKSITIITTALDGSARQILPAGAVNGCPAWSPDGNWAAFTSHPLDSQRNDIDILNVSSSSLAQMPPPDQPGDESAPGYDCPVWSPDGKSIAAVLRDTFGTRLAIIDRTIGLVRTVPVDSPSETARPVWLPDGQTVLLAEEPVGNGSSSIMAVHIQAFAWIGEMINLASTNKVQAMALSPDGKHMAIIAIRSSSGGLSSTADLLIYRLGESTPTITEKLPGYDPQMLKQPGRMVWLSDNQVLFAQPENWLSNHKAVFTSLDLVTGELTNLAFSADVISDWSWKDGWLVYSSESGVWAQKVNIDEPASALPFHLSDGPVSSLDIR